jgi:2-amino-4-hydroxy-6-hydroxymethyldihydropteridine diphosphokinase
MPRAGIALGSNLGDRMGHLRAALDALRQIASPGEPVLTAPVYQTEPHFCQPGSPDFLNTVVEIGFNGSPLELLSRTRTFEKQLGRTRGAERNTPRTIDIDLLYLGDEILDDGELTLPHPRIGERRFVLQPLADIRPELVLPGQSRSVAEMLAGLKEDESPLIPVCDKPW